MVLMLFTPILKARADERSKILITEEQYNSLTTAMSSSSATTRKNAVTNICKPIFADLGYSTIVEFYKAYFGENNVVNVANKIYANGVACYFTTEEQSGTGECEHEWQDATCTEPKTCAKCGATEGVPNGHKWIDPTCTQAGKCEICGIRNLVNGMAAYPLGHDYDDNFRCKRCNYQHVHAMTDWMFEPDDYSTHYRVCGDMCKINEDGSNAIIEIENHEFAYDENSKKMICKKCGCEKAHTHEWSEWIEWNKEGCSQKHRRKCSICSKEEYEAHEYLGGKCTKCGYETDIYKRYAKYTALYKKSNKNVNVFYAAEIRNFGFASITEYLNVIKALETGGEIPEIHPFVENTTLTPDAVVENGNVGAIKIFSSDPVKIGD